MFESARLKLTAWYLLIIMLISGFFSMAFYQAATQEIQIIMRKIEHEQHKQQYGHPDYPRRYSLPPFSLEDLQAVKDRIKFNLIFLNGFIFIVSGAAGYFLAGRTLRPIKLMIDEQNQFISSASHELRTPISTMRAEMEGSLLEKNISDREARHLINSNLEELSTLQDLTNSLLRLAHVHNVKAEKYAEVLSIADILHAAKKKITPLAKKKNIVIDIDSADAEIIGDKRSLIEVFVILLDNAIKYGPDKSQVTVKTVIEKGAIIVHVIDNGIGINKKDLQHIFERFYRADKSRNKDGYGLGLSIAKKIIETHGGTITVQSKMKKGTTFTVQLPQQR
jgi:signal transduction histidine kinase